jgi:hypothetical protein
MSVTIEEEACKFRHSQHFVNSPTFSLSVPVYVGYQCENVLHNCKHLMNCDHADELMLLYQKMKGFAIHQGRFVISLKSLFTRSRASGHAQKMPHTRSSQITLRPSHKNACNEEI